MSKKIKKGDMVVVIAGDARHLPDEKRTGKVLAVDRKKNTVLVESIKVRKRSRKRSTSNPQGGYIERESPVHISNVMLKETFDSKFQRPGS